MPETTLHAYPQPWVHPLALAQACGDDDMALLYSANGAHARARYSLLACDPLEECTGGIADLEKRLSTDKPWYENAWFGYLGYGLRHETEQLANIPPPPIIAPDMRMVNYGRIYHFDHVEHTLTCYSHKPPQNFPGNLPLPQPKRARCLQLRSNMTDEIYRRGVYDIIQAIQAGNVYQCNLTRKYYGTLSERPSGLEMFTALCTKSPADYSAYIRMGGIEILSSSPECFLQLGADGTVSTRPIKGSAPRGRSDVEDQRLREELQQSPKERAENLMITDLMRNDLARSCSPGSMRVGELFEVTTHPTIHHLSSTVSGRLGAEAGVAGLLRGCFPPGSMTGAPKVSAMRLIDSLEGLERGIYSGALGWLGGNGGGELSVVIRTVILEGDGFEFQAGSGIVADSDPSHEIAEMHLKCCGMSYILGIKQENLKF